MSDLVIYHNPKCGTSRNTLALLREKGLEPKVVEYLQVGWTEALLKDLVARSGAPLKSFLRTLGTEAQALGLTEPTVSDATLLKAMVADPILVNRPIVSTGKGVALCRPVERVLDLI